MSEMVKVYICKTCLKTSVFSESGAAPCYSEFVAKVEDILNVKDSKNRWEAELGSCADTCPENKISLTISVLPQSQNVDLTNSDLPTVESVVQKCLQVISDKLK